MTSPIMRYFEGTDRHREGLPRDTFLAFAELAQEVDSLLPDGAEKSVALRSLLTGKDAAVRAAYDAVEGS